MNKTILLQSTCHADGYYAMPLLRHCCCHGKRAGAQKVAQDMVRVFTRYDDTLIAPLLIDAAPFYIVFYEMRRCFFA